MHKLKLVLLVVLGLIVGLLIPKPNLPSVKFLQPKLTPSPRLSESDQAHQKYLAELEKYIVDIPLQYFDADEINEYDLNGTNSKILRNIYVTSLPERISPGDDVEVFSEPYDLIEVCEDCRIQKDSQFDVDNDGRKEQILYVVGGFLHGAKDAYIVKDGIVIFKELAEPVEITESKSGNGFYLNYYYNTDRGAPGQIKKIRYIHDQSKFIPVWSQVSNELLTTSY